MILCDVNSFKAIEPINKAEEKYFKEGIDFQKLKKQHKLFVDSLHANISEEIRVLESSESCPEQVFVRDVAFKIDNTWCICNMATKIRQGETDEFIKFLKSCNKSFYRFKSNIEGGDVLVWNQTIFVGVSSRTSIEAVEELAELFKNYDIIPIKLKKDILHLDCVLGIVDYENAVIYKDGLDEMSVQFLKKLFNLIEITKEEQENMATNFLRLDDKIFCEAKNKRVNKLIGKLGVKVIEVEFDEYRKLGGSLRCCSLEYDINDFINKKYLTCIDNQLHYQGMNLYSLVKKYGNPIKVGCPNMIKDKILGLKSLFKKAIIQNNYQGKYYYANANKASYYAENVITAGKYADFYETSSVSDLVIVRRVLSKGIVEKKKIICNGIKDDEYLLLIKKMVDEGYEILDIVDNIEEFKTIASYKFKRTLELGLRVKLESIYSKNSKVVKYDRFGLYQDEIDYIIKNYKSNPKLNLTTIHYHLRGSIFDEGKFITSLTSAFDVYAKAIKKDESIVNLDIGGGCPYYKIGEFDYQKYVNLIIKTLIELSKKEKVKEPNVIQENGRYTVSDSCFNIYKVTNVKKDDKDWYIVNDSFMTSLPNSWALGEEFLVLPINLWENKKIPVCLAGNTCDCDDVYYYQSKDEFMLPEIKDGQTLFVGVFGMGAYQEILSGIGGIHHCLNREENDLIIYKKNHKTKYYHVRKVQSQKYLFKRLLYKNKFTMRKFN